MELKGKHVVVTGGSRGIGEQLARQFASRGAKVTVVARSVDALEAVASAIGGNAVVSDLSDDLSVDVLLLSDINYEPQAFETLFNVIISFLEKGTTILLSTPQRLMAKPFIDRILPYSIFWDEKFVSNTTPVVACSIYVLQEK